MSVEAADIQIRLSGGAGNTDPNASLGGAMSSTELVDNSLHNLFDSVSGPEHTAGDNEYRAVYIRNNHGSLTAQSVVVWISTDSTSSESELDIALQDEAVNTNMETVANENTAPSGESFSHPSSRGAGIALGNLAPGDRRGIWIKRMITAGSTAQANDTAVLSIGWDTL